jgi:hypothetical protein
MTPPAMKETEIVEENNHTKDENRPHRKKKDSSDDISRVFQGWCKASENHLRSPQIPTGLSDSPLISIWVEYVKKIS